MISFYLAHHFGCRRLIRKWELMIENKYNINLLNPFYDNKQRTEMIELDKMKDGSKEQMEYFRGRNTTTLVDSDLEKIRKSDGLVAYVYEKSLGTPMEIFFAARILKIPVFVITKRYAYHPWIKKFATKIFPNRTAFEKYVEEEFGHRNDSTGYYNME